MTALSRPRKTCARCDAAGHNARTCTTGLLDPDERPESNSRSVRTLRRADLTPCTRCGLRGHVAGDPDRCLYYRGSLGLGGQAAVAIGEARVRRGKADPFHRSVGER